jgi:hypothetical protein
LDRSAESLRIPPFVAILIGLSRRYGGRRGRRLDRCGWTIRVRAILLLGFDPVWAVRLLAVAGPCAAEAVRIIGERAPCCGRR